MYLVDTNVVSELRRPRPHGGVHAWLASVANDQLHLSSLTLGELQVGDFVIASDGRPTEVLGVYPQGFREIYRVYTQDGSSTLASGDHLWSVHPRDDRRRGCH